MNQEEKLQQEILGDAERKASRLIDRAKRDAEKLLDSARDEQASERRQRLQEAQREADERARAITASVEHDKRRRWLTRREKVIQEVCDRALDNLTDAGADSTNMLQELLQQALRSVDSPEMTVQVPVGQGERFETEILPRVVDLEPDTIGGKTLNVTEDPQVTGGLIVTSGDGHRRYDNTFTARLDRLRDSVRREIIAMMEPSTESESNNLKTD